MQVTPEFIRRVQEAGWHIVQADVESLWIGCPRGGCNLKTRLKAGGAIPTVCRTAPPVAQIVVEDYRNAARRALRSRREQLGLTIKDVEEVSGIADDHLAKMEKDDPTKIPNVLTFIDWVRALGFQIVLVPDDLPQITINKIAETREAQERRRAAYKHFGRFRKGRAVALLPKP